MTRLDSIASLQPPTAEAIVPAGIRRALAHMRGNLERQLTLAELVLASRVPARTLQRQFRLFLGAAPLVHLRRMRLAAARQALLEAAPGASVTAIAARNGLGHAGRFSVDYRACFGESPSDTLARASQTSASARQDEQAASLPPSLWRYRPTLAILPFRCDNGQLAHPQLGELLGEQLAALLARTHRLAVRLGTAAPAGATRAVNECSARYGLTGRIASTPSGQLRIVTRLLDLEAGGVHLWGDAFDGDAAVPLALLDQEVTS